MKTEVDGRKFDSKREAAEYRRLKAEQIAGRITGLRCQVSFPLRVNGVLVCRYRADFVHIEGGARVVTDVKGMITPEYKLKRKLMLACWGIEIREVR